MFERLPGTIYTLAPAALIIILVLGIIIYAIALALFLFGSLWPQEKTWRASAVEFFKSGERSYLFHIPISAACAFGMVLAFEYISPYVKDSSTFSFEAFGLKFSGPAAPGTLWVICFLALIWSLKLLSPTTKQNSATELER